MFPGKGPPTSERQVAPILIFGFDSRHRRFSTRALYDGHTAQADHQALVVSESTLECKTFARELLRERATSSHATLDRSGKGL